MAGLNVRQYENEVLKPLRKQLPHLSDDLLTRYAVRLDMAEAEIRERVDAVVNHWNKVAMRPGQLSIVCKQLQREHQVLKATPNAFTPAWLAEKVAERTRALAPEIAALAGYLTANYGPLGAITEARLAAEASDALGDAERHQARTDAKLQLVDPLDLPTVPGTHGQYKSFENDLVSSGARSVVELVHPDVTEFGLVDGLTVSPPPSHAALSAAALEDRAREIEKLPDSTEVRARKTALGFLRTEQSAGTDLAVLTLFHLLGSVRARRTAGTSGPQPLLTLLTRSGLRAGDAARIVLSVLEETAVAHDPVAEVTDLLAEGRLEAARQAAASLPGEHGTVAREAVDRQRQQVDELRRRAREHLAAGDEEQAGDRLSDAQRLASDLEAVTTELVAVPTPPVRLASAGAEGGGVRVGWQPASRHGGTTEFRVVRREGRAPTDVDDGRQVPVQAGHATFDTAPPVGRRLHYAVFARAGTGPWSRPTSADVEVVPPVTDVVVEGDEKTVTGRWLVHPEATDVRVTRSVGGAGTVEEIRVERNGSFRDAGVEDGVRYHYTIVASYLTPSGVQRAEPVVVRGATRPKVRPVTTLKAAAEVVETGTALRLSWRQRAGSEVVIRRAARPCPWEYGQTVSRAELRGYGDELEGVRSERGDAVTLIAPAPLGRSYCVVFTIGADGAMRGEEAVVDLSEPVRGVRAQRFGEDVRVTWTWPEEISTAEVTWVGGRRRITRQRYRDEGGCQLHGVPRVTRVDVHPVLPGADGETADSAPATSVEVDRVPPRLRYDVHRRGHALFGGVKCTVTVSATEAVGAVTVLLVAAVGPVLPQSPDDCYELLRSSIWIGPDATEVLPEVVVPKYVRKPYWLRCFLVEPENALLDDPPTSSLKVS